jgi:glutamate/tyrosine decarboxylase-like PLP-dependent enzyme
MGVPIPSSVLFVRDRGEFGRMSVHSSYFNREESDVPDPGLRSPPSTRPMSALPLVTSIRHQGLSGLRRRLRAPITAISGLADRLAFDPEVTVVCPPDTGVLCLRVEPAGVDPAGIDALQPEVYEAIARSGERSISITRVAGRPVLRLVAVSPAVTAEALLESVTAIKAAARASLARPSSG